MKESLFDGVSFVSFYPCDNLEKRKFEECTGEKKNLEKLDEIENLVKKNINDVFEEEDEEEEEEKEEEEEEKEEEEEDDIEQSESELEEEYDIYIPKEFNPILCNPNYSKKRHLSSRKKKPKIIKMKI